MSEQHPFYYNACYNIVMDEVEAVMTVRQDDPGAGRYTRIPTVSNALRDLPDHRGQVAG